MASFAEPRREIRARSRGRGISWQTLLTILILAFGAVLMIAPFMWIIQAAFGETSKAYVVPPRWLPESPTLENFDSVFTQVPFAQFMLNSLKLAVIVTIGQLITCSMAAYAFARLHFPGKNLLFFLLISALMIPGQVTLVPLFPRR